MSLFDTDKESLDRGSPKPNSHDVVAEGAQMAHKTISTHYKTDADSDTGHIKMDNKRIIINDGTNDRIIIGYQQGGF